MSKMTPPLTLLQKRVSESIPPATSNVDAARIYAEAKHDCKTDFELTYRVVQGAARAMIVRPSAGAYGQFWLETDKLYVVCHFDVQLVMSLNKLMLCRLGTTDRNTEAIQELDPSRSAFGPIEASYGNPISLLVDMAEHHHHELLNESGGKEWWHDRGGLLAMVLSGVDQREAISAYFAPVRAYRVSQETGVE